jgi:hypothetical protein
VHKVLKVHRELKEPIQELKVRQDHKDLKVHRVHRVLILGLKELKVRQDHKELKVHKVPLQGHRVM